MTRSTESTSEVVSVSQADSGRRLDVVLAEQLTQLSRTRLQALVRGGCVRIGSRVSADPGVKVKTGDTITVTIPPPEPAKPAAEAITLDVVFEDDSLIVIDKPAGLVVHPAPGNRSGTLVNALIAHCGDSLSGIGGERRPGIVHRLDKETSGLLVVAKTDTAHRGLAEQFSAHGRDGRLTRSYWALVWGMFDRPKGSIDAAIGRAAHNRTKMAVVSGSHGRAAVSHYRVLETYCDPDDRGVASFIEVQLETGRTHQIRVHMAHIGHPVIGDPVYGTGFKSTARRLRPVVRDVVSGLGRQALHAARLGFEHPVSGQDLQFESTWPGDLEAVRQALRGDQKT